MLEQLDAEFKEIAAQVQDAKKRQTSKTAGTKTTKKGTKKPKAAAKHTESEEATETSEVESKGPDYLAQVTEAVVTAGTYVVEKRAWVLFGVTAVLIHLYGDYASV